MFNRLFLANWFDKTAHIAIRPKRDLIDVIYKYDLLLLNVLDFCVFEYVQHSCSKCRVS